MLDFVPVLLFDCEFVLLFDFELALLFVLGFVTLILQVALAPDFISSVILAMPSFFPVILPFSFTVAIFLLLDDHFQLYHHKFLVLF